MRFTTLASAAALLAATLQATPAAAQNTATAGGKAILLIPLTVTNIQDLDFGTVVSPSSPGTLALSNTNVATPGGGVTTLAGTTQPALFDWAGSPDQQVTLVVETALPLALNNAANDPGVTLDSLDIPAGPLTVDSTGVLEIPVGGQISIGANQPDGIYTGTFVVHVDYN